MYFAKSQNLISRDHNLYFPKSQNMIAKDHHVYRSRSQNLISRDHHLCCTQELTSPQPRAHKAKQPGQAASQPQVPSAAVCGCHCGCLNYHPPCCCGLSFWGVGSAAAAPVTVEFGSVLCNFKVLFGSWLKSDCFVNLSTMSCAF